MRQLKAKFRLNEEGVSLVEVVASVVLLTFIILSGYYMFVQSAKTTKTSEDIIDATYIAQTEMEELYSLSQTPGASSFHDTVIDGTYFKGSDATNKTAFQGIDIDGNPYDYYLKNNSTSDMEVRLTYDDFNIGSSKLVRVVIRVYDKNGDILKAQMETTLDWGS